MPPSHAIDIVYTPTTHIDNAPHSTVRQCIVRAVACMRIYRCVHAYAYTYVGIRMRVRARADS